MDVKDYLLLSPFIGRVIGSYVKNYLSEKRAMERLKNSIINKSSSSLKEDSTFKSKQSKIKKIYKFALDNRGGQFGNFDYIPNDDAIKFKLATKIKTVVQQFAAYLKHKELYGQLNILFIPKFK